VICFFFDTNQFPLALQVSISSTFYEQLLRMKVLRTAFSSYVLDLANVRKHFRTKNTRVKCWWNIQQLPQRRLCSLRKWSKVSRTKSFHFFFFIKVLSKHMMHTVGHVLASTKLLLVKSLTMFVCLFVRLFDLLRIFFNLSKLGGRALLYHP